jgi:predicted DNA-binding transcriptional regulator AlpA
MESPFGAALRVEITNILGDLLGIKKPSDVILAELLPEAILREPQVCAITNLSHATVRRVAAGTFPPPVKLGDDRHGAASGWLASEVTNWMRALRREEAESAGSVEPSKPVVIAATPADPVPK